MLQFRSNPTEHATGSRASHRLSNRLRWRLWMLLICLGLVFAAMRELNKPTTAERLGQIFGTSESLSTSESEHQFVISPADSSPDMPKLSDESPQPTKPTNRTDGMLDNDLAQVQDNTYFRPSETSAWFGLFERLQNTNDQEIRNASLGEVTYAQLLKQPDTYRGQVVTIRGMLRREEVERPADNTLGITSYHRLVLQPRGGGHWPFIVYCLVLPSELPRGDNLQAALEVDGLFFKNWSYAWQDGLGIAPVILARNVRWLPTPTPQTRRPVTQQELTKALVAACGFALLVVFVVMRNTRRSPRSSTATQTVDLPEATAVETLDEKLQRLSHEEPRE